ncbi:MAG: tetratricopeptide repeat protein [Proteobacteria bacterium]|nr:tetratricopeptide repeat protein [Pseudomonadota bacterium]
MNERRASRFAFAAASLAPLVVLLAACSGSAEPGGKTLQDATAAIARNDYDAAGKALGAVLTSNPNDKEAQFLSGQVALELGNGYGAINQFNRLLNDPAYTARVTPLLAKAYLTSGKPDEALRLLGTGEPADAQSFAVAVQASAATGDFKRVKGLLDSGLARFPQSPELLALDGLRAVAMGDNARADAIAAGLRKSAPDNVDAMLFAGQLALEHRQLDVANEVFSHLHQIRPHHQAPMLGLGMIASLRGDAAGAKRWIGDARTAAPDNPMVAIAAAELALAAGDGNQALKVLGVAGDQNDRFPRLGLLSGLANAKVGNNQQAISQLTAFFDRRGDDPRGRLVLAALMAQAGDKPGGWQILKPLALAPNAPPEALRLAADLAGAAHDPAAAGLAQRAAASGKADPDAAAMIAADKAIRSGQWREADGIYARLLGGPNGGRPILLNNAAYVKIEMGDANGAVTLARRAQALAPNDATVLDTLGWALFKAKGPSAEARELLARAAKLRPDNQTITQHLTALSQHS